LWIDLIYFSGIYLKFDEFATINVHVSEFEKNVGDRVFFKLDSSEISSESQATLSRQAAWLKDHKLFSLTAEGHCDERGTREYNMALGEKRAEAVKRYLLSHGVSEDRVETVSYGKERPAVIGNDENAWSQNRRGVTVIK
jgi:peptidoglycan-associated lipoprotein